MSRLREASRRLPRALWLVVLVAFLHGAAWSVLTPAFQGPDEIAHFGYAEYVAKTGKPPARAAAYAVVAKDTGEALEALPWSVVGKPSWSPLLDRRVGATLDRIEARGVAAQELGAAYQTPNPPLYQYVTAIPYRVTAALGGNTFDRLVVLRLVTSAIGALAVLFVLLFLRELFPRNRWAWIAGGLAVALQPVFGFLIGSVNNDVPVLASGAALLWLLARAYRRGLSWPIAGAMGVAVTVGLLSKVSAYGLLAVLGWGLLVLLLQQRRSWRTLLPRAVVAVAVAAIPILVLHAVRHVTNVDLTATGVGTATDPTHQTAAAVAAPRNYREFASYLWQFWLPKLPWMDEQFPGYPDYPLWQTYIQAFAGRFGWFEFGFTPGSAKIMSWVLVALGVAAITTLGRRRTLVRSHGLLLILLVGAFVGYATMVNLAGWRYRLDTGANFEQVRYLFPMLGLYGALIAAALLAFPRRWHRGLVVVVAVAASLHVLAAWGLTLTRYYM